MEQDKIKPVLEYLAKQWNEQQKSTSTTSKPVQQKQQQVKDVQQIQDKIEVLHFDQPGDLKGRQSLFLLSPTFCLFICV
jgi:hypothetical protein